ncbi:MAG: Hsp20/alpha crystallin family protein [Deltaproteobacteria bacterium]|nr:Hsp20/alpha crystallin family protein [Deltaproteobacteria bacterium]
MTLTLSRRSNRPWWMTPLGREPLGDIFFDRLYPEWRRDMGEEVTPSIDFSEKDGKYFLTAELPGINKDDISITIEDGYVTLSGKKEENKEESGSNFYLKETKYGSFSRSFRLPGKVDENKVDATYKEGVLTVVMPQEEATETKKIEVH